MRMYMVMHMNGDRWVARPDTGLVRVGIWVTSAQAALWAFNRWGAASNGFTTQWAVDPIEIVKEVAA